MHGDKQPVDMKDRQGVDQPVFRREAPEIDQHLAIGRQIGLREHRALGLARRAGGIEDRRDIVARARNRRRFGFGQIGKELRQRRDLHRAAADPPEQIDRLVAADSQHRRCIDREVIQFAFGVVDIERQVDRTGPDRREIEDQRLDALVRLHQHTLACRDAQRLQPARQPPDHRRDLTVGPGPCAFLDEDTAAEAFEALRKA